MPPQPLVVDLAHFAPWVPRRHHSYSPLVARWPPSCGIRVAELFDRPPQKKTALWNEQETMVFTIKYRVFRLKFSHHPILWCWELDDFRLVKNGYPAWWTFTFCDGKIHHFWWENPLFRLGHVQLLFVCSPEGIFESVFVEGEGPLNRSFHMSFPLQFWIYQIIYHCSTLSASICKCLKAKDSSDGSNFRGLGLETCFDFTRENGQFPHGKSWFPNSANPWRNRENVLVQKKGPEVTLW